MAVQMTVLNLIRDLSSYQMWLGSHSKLTAKLCSSWSSEVKVFIGNSNKAQDKAAKCSSFFVF